MTHEEALRRPYVDEGAAAYRRRLGRACCPYGGGWQRWAWLAGWADAAAAEDAAVRRSAEQNR